MISKSGVTPITIFTKPHQCGGECIFCPTVNEIPKSYLPRVKLSNIGLSYSAESQINYWLSYILQRGGIGEKLEVIILGGSFAMHPNDYINEFICQIYKAIDGVYKSNSTAHDYVQRHQFLHGNRIIGITIEARPDQISRKLIENLFSYGVTKIEIGVQSTNNDILAFNRRDHDTTAVRQATSIIKDAGLKVGYHMLYGMPGSSMNIDIESTSEIFTCSDYLPDHLKIYFCEMFKREYMNQKIVDLYDAGIWKPFSKIERALLLKSIIPLIPSYVRISRIGRKASPNDFEVDRPQIYRDQYEKLYNCNCIRCREPKKRLLEDDIEGHIRIYSISDNDIVIEFVSDKANTCIGILRLRRTDLNQAIIRELHVYGKEALLGQKGNYQHTGFGHKLLNAAEKEVTTTWSIHTIGVASGVGVRAYFERLGYGLGKDNIMWKAIKKQHHDEGRFKGNYPITVHPLQSNTILR